MLAHGGDRKSVSLQSRDRSGPLIVKDRTHATRKRIAHETRTGEDHVERSRRFARGEDTAEEVLPGIKNEILSAAIKPTKGEVAAIAKANEADRLQMA